MGERENLSMCGGTQSVVASTVTICNGIANSSIGGSSVNQLHLGAPGSVLSQASCVSVNMNGGMCAPNGGPGTVLNTPLRGPIVNGCIGSVTISGNPPPPSSATSAGNAAKSKGPIRVGFYDIERTIGKGNFAVVKLARHRITKNEAFPDDLSTARRIRRDDPMAQAGTMAVMGIGIAKDTAMEVFEKGVSAQQGTNVNVFGKELGYNKTAGISGGKSESGKDSSERKRRSLDIGWVPHSHRYRKTVNLGYPWAPASFIVQNKGQTDAQVLGQNAGKGAGVDAEKDARVDVGKGAHVDAEKSTGIDAGKNAGAVVGKSARQDGAKQGIELKNKLIMVKPGQKVRPAGASSMRCSSIVCTAVGVVGNVIRGLLF